MKLIQKNGLVRPAEDKDLWLFKHCANNQIAVTTDVYEKDVQWLLFLHDVPSIEMTYEVGDIDGLDLVGLPSEVIT